MINGDNAVLLEALYLQFKSDPSTVTQDWANYFQELDNGSFPGENSAFYEKKDKPADENLEYKDVGLQKLIDCYRQYGHLAARLDPLDLIKPERDALSLRAHKLNENDKEYQFDSGISALGKSSLRNILSWMEKTYCSSIGAEHHYLVNHEERIWLQEEMEKNANTEQLPVAIRLRLFEKIFQAESFEKFLAQKFVGKKRFSLEGGETFIALLDAIIEEAGRLNMKKLSIGMAHRGRLNVLVNIMKKPAGVIFAEFAENYNPETIDYADVKYHLGYSSSIMTRTGREIEVILAFNPSHLEAADPVVIGAIRARQAMDPNGDREAYMPIIVHGDASFPGQGVVAETLNMNNLDGYTVKGSLHIVLNNQIGFTTLPNESRSTRYATDMAKGFQIPIFHVNADDPEACFRVVRLCMNYRKRFKKDVIIDLICYRRLGHNENDEPSFTQPLIYKRIKKHPTTASIYEERLISHDDISDADIDFIKKGIKAGLESSFRRAKDENIQMVVDIDRGSMAGQFSDKPGTQEMRSILKKQLERIIPAITSVPNDFHIHAKLKRLIDTRTAMSKGEVLCDWGFAEALSLGSILESGFHVRLSGQDAQRGTFSHRHAVIVDIENGSKWVALNSISQKQGRFEAINSPLSEYAVLGFEYGYSMSDPRTLVIWEAQFGDFVNGSQIIIDQFITSSGVKWHRMSGLVLLLPHGYEGQGPEHSSARLERFLQLCASDNIQVCNCTTPAQYFHLLRRQMICGIRKPLIILTPKSLLRLPEAGSSIEELYSGIFNPLLMDKNIQGPAEVTRLLFVSGKIYYDLLTRRTAQEIKHIAILRIEQLYPFPEKEIRRALDTFKNAQQFYWVQEEPVNMGAWFYMESRFKKHFPDIKLEYIARPESPSPAAGLMVFHKREQESLVESALEK